MTEPEFAEAVRAGDRAHGQCGQCGRTGTASRDLGGGSVLYSWPYGGAERYVCRGPCRDPEADDSLYFGPCLNPAGDDPVKSLMSGFAHSRQHVNGDAEWFAKQARGTAPEPTPDGFIVPQGLSARPKPPPTWRTRLRWKREQWRERTARRAFKVIAGYWPDSGEDDW